MARSHRGWRVVFTILICAPAVAGGIWAAIAALKEEDAQTSDQTVKVQPASASSASAGSDHRTALRGATLASQKVNSTSRPPSPIATAPATDANHSVLGNGSLVGPGGTTPGALDVGLPLTVPSPDDLTIGVQPAKP